MECAAWPFSTGCTRRGKTSAMELELRRTEILPSCGWSSRWKDQRNEFGIATMTRICVRPSRTWGWKDQRNGFGIATADHGPAPMHDVERPAQ